MAKGFPAGPSFLQQRLEVLRRTQNADGGWGYFAGRTSWLEPTAYAAMALHGESAADRAWKLLCSWQTADGGWRPSEAAREPAWGGSVCLSIALGRKEWQDASRIPALRKTVSWLFESSGAESNWFLIAMHMFNGGRDYGLQGWPWKPGDSSWVEPTSHALVALKQAAPHFPSRKLKDRVRVGEAQLFDVRSYDGGWNYGNADAQGVQLPSYPETTALALLGLQERGDLGPAFETADRLLEHTPSPLARAWLSIARRLHGMPVPALQGNPTGDLMLTAVEALAAPEGNHWFLKTSAGGRPQ